MGKGVGFFVPSILRAGQETGQFELPDLEIRKSGGAFMYVY